MAASQSLTVWSTRTRGQGLSIRTPRYAQNRVQSCPCKLASSLPVAASQSFTVLSREPEARVFPSGLHATLETESSVPLQGRQQFARGGLPELHRPVIRTRGQGLSIRTPRYAVKPRQCAPARSSAVCPWRPPRASLSCHREPEARVFPSGLQATLKTASVCPCKVASSLPVAASQSFTVWSQEPEARVFPSGLHATL